MTITVRRLVPGDEASAEAFLARTPETTIFLRSNLSRVGFLDDGSQFSGTYAGAFDGEHLAGMAAIFWNTNVVVAPGPHAERASAHAVELSGRTVGGILGPHEEVVRARAALGLGGTEPRYWSKEILYTLALDELIVPPALADGRLVAREPLPGEIDALLDWRMEYAAETTNIPDTPETRAEEKLRLTRYQEQGHHFVVTTSGERVAYSAFNATIADVVQIGGVWTPPALRGRGYARCVVAGSLQTARDRGVRRAVLFTGETNPAAQAAYVAIGFEPIGDYAIVLFRA